MTKHLFPLHSKSKERYSFDGMLKFRNHDGHFSFFSIFAAVQKQNKEELLMRNIVYSTQLKHDLALTISECEHDRIFLLVDENTETHCLPLIISFFSLKEATIIRIPAGEKNKNVNALTHIWSALSNGCATRHSLLISLGGGTVTDVGGLAASTFKRGINFINIPTTLLGMVDASVGGKNGINFNGLKNEVGTFAQPRFTLIHTPFLQTLPYSELLSGFAEMLKHALLDKEQTWSDILTFDIDKPDLTQLQRMVETSVRIKEKFVDLDPHEKGIRKALNFGHTFGHAFEAFSNGKLLHGHAVAHGMVCALYLSALKTGFPTERMRQTVSFIREHYGRPAIYCDDYEQLYSLMLHDKKNKGDNIMLTLLAGFGDIKTNQTPSKEEIFEALDFAREG